MSAAAASVASGAGSELPAGREFRNRLLLVSMLLSAASAVLIAGYAFALMQLPRQQWIGFGWFVVAIFPVLYSFQAWVLRRIWEPIVRCLDLRREGPCEREVVEQGFAAVANYPLRMLLWGTFWWVVGGLVLAGCMRLRFESFALASARTMLMAASSGGFVAAVFHFLVMKREVEPVRNAFAREIPDPDLRRSLVIRIPLARKLWVAIAGVTLVTGLFMIQISQARSDQTIEMHTSNMHQRFLLGIAAEISEGGIPALKPAWNEARRLGIADELLLLDSTGTTLLAGDPARLQPAEMERLREMGVEAGDSRFFQSRSLFTWLSTSAGVLVAVSEWESLRGDQSSARIMFVLLLVVSTGMAALHNGEPSNRYKVAKQIVAHLFEQERRDHLRTTGIDDGVAIRHRCEADLHGYHAADAGSVVDHELLPQRLTEGRREDAHGVVERAARLLAHHQTNRFSRIGGNLCGGACRCQ